MRFRKLIRDNNLVVNPKDPKDNDLRDLWLQILDQVMSEKVVSKGPVAPPFHRPQMTSRLTSRSPCLELKTIGDPSKFNQSRHVGIYEYSDRDIEGIAYYPSNAPATNAHFDASLKRVPIVFIAAGRAGFTYYNPRNPLETYLKTFADEDNPDRPCSPPPTSWYPISTYRGFEYFQEQLAKQGIIAISVNFVKIDDAKINDHDKNEDDITNRAKLIKSSIEYFLRLDSDPTSLFYNHIDFQSLGLMGHSRGGEASNFTCRTDAPNINAI